MPPRPYTCSAPPALLFSMPPRYHACSAPPDLQFFISPRRHACNSATRFSSRAPHLYPSTSVTDRPEPHLTEARTDTWRLGGPASFIGQNLTNHASSLRKHFISVGR